MIKRVTILALSRCIGRLSLDGGRESESRKIDAESPMVTGLSLKHAIDKP